MLHFEPEEHPGASIAVVAAYYRMMGFEVEECDQVEGLLLVQNPRLNFVLWVLVLFGDVGSCKNGRYIDRAFNVIARTLQGEPPRVVFLPITR